MSVTTKSSSFFDTTKGSVSTINNKPHLLIISMMAQQKKANTPDEGGDLEFNAGLDRKKMYQVSNLNVF